MIIFDTIMLACAARGLQESVIGAKVERIAQPMPHTTQWTLVAHGRKVTLVIETDAVSSRLHLTKRARQSPQTPPSFCMLLRKRLGDAWLEGIEHPLGFGERVARLVFAAPDGFRYSFYVELMGRHSNQMLVDDSGTILGAIKRVTPDMSRFREIRGGLPYTLPPRQRGARRDVFSPIAGNQLPDANFADEAEAEAWIAKTFTGVSPLMAREGIARRPEPALTSENVWFGLNNLINYVRLADYAPVLTTDALGRITGAYPVALRSIPGARQPVAASFSGALDDALDALEQRSTFDEEKTALISALRRAHHILEKEALDTQEGLANAGRAPEYETLGNLILTALPKIHTGETSAKVMDYELGKEIEIELDPVLNGHQNAERYFKKAAKARNSRAHLEARLQEIEQRMARIDIEMPRIEAAASIDAVQALAQSLDAIRVLGEPRGAAVESEKAPPNPYAGYKIKIYHSVDGWEILVGENAVSNDFLTTKIASPSDIWLHARSQTSAHAIIRTGNRPAAVSTAALRYAAEQVARRSVAKHSRLVPVDYTLRKYVRKPRGSNPGQVIYTREKTIDVTPDGE